jgi:hypothetical protein
MSGCLQYIVPYIQYTGTYGTDLASPPLPLQLLILVRFSSYKLIIGCLSNIDLSTWGGILFERAYTMCIHTRVVFFVIFERFYALAINL